MSGLKQALVVALGVLAMIGGLIAATLVEMNKATTAAPAPRPAVSRAAISRTATSTTATVSGWPPSSAVVRLD